MITINLYNFSKKTNSTKRPSGSGSAYSCAVKTGSSIINPVIEISTNTLPAYNYAYISNFKRYYFVSNIVYDRGIWVLSLNVDVLASYRPTINNLSGYVTRSSAASDGWLIDRYYPVRSTYRTDNIVLNANETVTWASGTVAISVVDPSSTSGYTVYVFTAANFATFLSKLSSNLTDCSVSTWDSVTQSIKVTTYEPLRFIGSVYWFPEGTVQGVNKTSLKLGNYEVTGILCTQPVSFPTTGRSYVIDIPKHPQISRGQYMNLSPFSEYTLSLGPFGGIKLDTSGLNGQSYLHVVIDADYLTGVGRAYITAGNNVITDITDDVMIANVVTQYGVPVRITSVNNVTSGNIIQTVGGLAATIGGVAAGDISTAIAGAQAAVGGIENMAKGSVDSVGSTGSIADHMMKKILYCRFFYAAEEDIANYGRPLCSTRRLGSIPGYIQVQKGEFTSEDATRTEIDAVNSYLETGFYYE